MSTGRDSGEAAIGTPALTIGVTGHRQLDNEAAISRQVAAAIDCIGKHFQTDAGGMPPLRVVSAIAEGADRIVAERAMERGATLEVILPLEPDVYAEDFESPDSKAQFADLLARAESVRHVTDAPSRERAYEAASRAVVDRCDVLIVIYDGKGSGGRGGTKDTMDYARGRRVPIMEIASAEPFAISAELLPEPPDPEETKRKLQAYRDQRVSRHKVHAHTRTQHARWDPKGRPDLDDLDVTRLIEWSLKEYPRADLLATRYQRRHDWASWLLFALPVVAVGTVAVQLFLAPRTPRWTLIEVGALLLIVVVLMWSRHRRYHDNWISYRFLAERLRSAYFLAVAGTSDQRARQESVAYFTDPSDEWIKNLLETHSSSRPPVEQTSVTAVRTYLAQFWIEDQAQYFCRASRRNETWEKVMRRATLVLFFGALVVAAFHSWSHGKAEPRPWSTESVIIQLSILIPVVGAAIHGLRGLREHRRHAERYRRMVTLLRVLRRRMYAAEDLATVQSVARDVEHVTRDENNDWFGVTRFHDVELIT